MQEAPAHPQPPATLHTAEEPGSRCRRGGPLMRDKRRPLLLRRRGDGRSCFSLSFLASRISPTPTEKGSRRERAGEEKQRVPRRSANPPTPTTPHYTITHPPARYLESRFSEPGGVELGGVMGGMGWGVGVGRVIRRACGYGFTPGAERTGARCVSPA
ncbi:hypothetical protein DPEC_G00235630 [Dallia pectoralis]|uniref:Uncharacterized protein n=1 Tax=Dallia pectoralis TaxID=75939 RepID=A0ACC2FY36_DALPE|nr:hypothetical protein DPEC_G00235630 [Dallia pectoralis]